MLVFNNFEIIFFNYIIVKYEGYTGSRCDSFIDLCKKNKCKNNGKCRTDLNGTVYCSCSPGFKGQYCDKQINTCDSLPCLHNSNCLNFSTSYVCVCPKNYRGLNCEEKLDVCKSMPCQNNATCISNDFGFSCKCSKGFKGEICQIPVSTCASFPCMYGSCVDKVYLKCFKLLKCYFWVIFFWNFLNT